ncbi:hypothetical protein SCP_0412870 [Sparassis crispa]|uniref:Uncharacterized protein n=1 Tax=Sparassis crispa TaxID=139825 RepID=A0A401GL69_9APHY|nr:hypothetical protein SCP_0412870 [Sparassis crispa]GBE82900.1 hypothetical protein SCP_0412870 [Sparassis crispa]
MPAIPAWLRARFRQMSLYPPSLEASWYGPIDRLANLVFSDDHYMVKPQTKLRESVYAGEEPNDEEPDDEEPDDEETDDDESSDEGSDEEVHNAELWQEGLSTDSMGKVVQALSRDTKVYIPDFVVVLCDGIRDIPVMCIEVKKNDESQESSIIQLREYMSIIGGKDPHEDFVGMLVLGGRFYTFRFQITKEDDSEGEAQKQVTARRNPTPMGKGWDTAEKLEGAFLTVVKNVAKREKLEAEA